MSTFSFFPLWDSQPHTLLCPFPAKLSSVPTGLLIPREINALTLPFLTEHTLLFLDLPEIWSPPGRRHLLQSSSVTTFRSLMRVYLPRSADEARWWGQCPHTPVCKTVTPLQGNPLGLTLPGYPSFPYPSVPLPLPSSWSSSVRKGRPLPRRVSLLTLSHPALPHPPPTATAALFTSSLPGVPLSGTGCQPSGCTTTLQAL